jgi:hypothetical protein
MNFEDGMQLISQRIYGLYLNNEKLYKVQMKMGDNDREFVKLKLSRSVKEVLENYFESQLARKIVNGNPELMAITLVNSLLGIFTVEILGERSFTNITWEEMVAEHTRQFTSLYKL